MKNIFFTVLVLFFSTSLLYANEISTLNINSSNNKTNGIRGLKKINSPKYNTRRRNQQSFNTSFGNKDSNNDGSISKQEFLLLKEQEFNLIDTNKDGKISPDELKSYKKPIINKEKI